jgi:hypothetical protein
MVTGVLDPHSDILEHPFIWNLELRVPVSLVQLNIVLGKDGLSSAKAHMCFGVRAGRALLRWRKKLEPSDHVLSFVIHLNLRRLLDRRLLVGRWQRWGRAGVLRWF